MKGMLLKDLYMLWRYGRALLLVAVVFLAFGFWNSGNAFFTAYPVLLIGLLPVTLISYDEHSRWNQYSLTLPVPRSCDVTVKYLTALASVGVTAVLTCVVMGISGGAESIVDALGVLTFIGLFGPTILLPVVYKFGSNKGRIVYYIVIVGFSAGVTAYSTIKPEGLFYFPDDLRLGGLGVLTLLLYALSWRLSIRFYNKREI